MKTKVYIAGKVSGLPYKEVKTRFDFMQFVLESNGFEAVNPLQVVNNPKCEWKPAMRQCIKALMDCDALFLLSDVADSPGAKVEMGLACELSIPMFRSVGMLKLHFKKPKVAAYGLE